jgi:hypothetical protein
VALRGAEIQGVQKPNLRNFHIERQHQCGHAWVSLPSTTTFAKPSTLRSIHLHSLQPGHRPRSLYHQSTQFSPADHLHSFRRRFWKEVRFIFSLLATSPQFLLLTVLSPPQLDPVQTFKHLHQRPPRLSSAIMMLPFKTKMTTQIILFTFFYTALAFWRLPCPNQIGIGRVDPLMALGAISDHSHTIHGGNSKYMYICSARRALLCAALTFTSLRLRRECHV